MKTAWAIAGIVAALLVVANYPQPFFPWSVTVDYLSLYSDEEFLAGDGEAVLKMVQGKLFESPL